MSVESVVYAALTGSAALSAYVQESGSPTTWRIYPEAAGQESQFPMVTWEVMSTDPVSSMDGSSTLVRALVSVECCASTLATAMSMADAVVAALFTNAADFNGLQQDRANDYDSEQRVWIVRTDFAVWV